MDMKDLRENINAIDDQLTDLFVQRMGIAKQVAAYKMENKLPVTDSSREREVVNRLCRRAGDEYAENVRALYSSLFEMSRSAQVREMKKDDPMVLSFAKALAETPDTFPRDAVVACQGVEGSYANAACDKLFPTPDILYFDRFEGVFNAVEKGLCRYGVLPIENSTAGSVTEVYDLMKKHSFTIVRSVKMHIQHLLLGNSGAKLPQIKEIYSHEQALRQCSEFLGTLKNVKIIPCENTAVAVKMVAASGRTDIAAIGSSAAASLYGLHTLSDDIQNRKNNFTRFICISRTPEVYAGADRISLMATLPHVTGSLYRMIAKFAVQGLNLLKLESRPLPDREFEFMFYFDFEGSVRDDAVKALLCEMHESADQMTYLGNYSEVV